MCVCVCVAGLELTAFKTDAQSPCFIPGEAADRTWPSVSKLKA